MLLPIIILMLLEMVNAESICCNTGQTIAFTIFALLITVVIFGMVLYHFRRTNRAMYNNRLVNAEYDAI